VLKRAYFPLIIIFWVTMNILLWRSEMSGSKDTGSPVSLDAVWGKVLTAPDDSAMQLFFQGRKLGYCRWAPNVGAEEATGKIADEDYEPEGRVHKLKDYTVDCDGSLVLGEQGRRLRFNCHVDFSTNQVWRKMDLRVVVRPLLWEIHAQTLKLRMDDRDSSVERTFTFAQLSQLDTLLPAFGNPLWLAWLGDSMQGFRGKSPRQLTLGLNWEARTDRFKIGHSRVRCYRLQVRLFDKYQVVLYLSRVGEILRAELPNDILLVNESLLGL
jgi:hypothetical protein